MKRKSEEKFSSVRKHGATGSEPASKKRRKDPIQAKAKAKAKAVADVAAASKKEPMVTAVSLLKEEGTSFPRGGSSVLTPLEQRQIQLQADQDVLFEESGYKPTQGDFDSDEELLDAGESKNHSLDRKKRNDAHATKKSKRKEAAHLADEQKPISADGLKFKRLAPGSMVLGIVSRLSQSEITLDLPNNLVGVVPLTGISHRVTEKLEAAAASQEDDNSSDEEAKDELSRLDLTQFVFKGQYLRAVVVSNHDEQSSADGGKPKKRVELSINPQLANDGISATDILENVMIQASVESVEDHGLVMDLGLADKSTKGFMGIKEIPSGVSLQSISQGAVFLCQVTSLSSNRKVVKLSANANKSGKITKGGALLDASTINSFLPGTAVEVLISRTTGKVIIGQIAGLIHATADVIHSGAASGEEDLESKHPIGSRAMARIIFTPAERQGKALKVSFQSHVLALSSMVSTDGIETEKKRFAVGATLENATVLNVEPDLGLFLDTNGPENAFVHISRVSDKHVSELSAEKGRYHVGTKHVARITAFNLIDNLYSASMEQSVLDQRFLQAEDVPVGEVLEVTLEKLVMNVSGVAGFVAIISAGINGFIPKFHITDVQTTAPEKKFKKGAKTTVRVLFVDPESRRIHLTMKKSLVRGETHIFQNYNQVNEGVEILGTIVKVNNSGAVVQFFGGILAFLPKSEMAESRVHDPLESFWPGKTVSTRVIAVNAKDKRMTVSCRPSSSNDEEHLSNFRKLQLGQLINGKVTEKASKGAVVTLEETDLKANLRTGHLSDKSSEENETALSKLRPNQTLRELVVLDLSEKSQTITVSRKPSLVRAAKEGKIVKDLNSLSSGQEVAGYVNNVTQDGVFVQFTGSLTALLHRNHIKAELKALPMFGLVKDDSVLSRVLHVDHGRKRFTLTMQDDFENKWNSAKDNDSNSDHLAIGALVQVRITSVKDTQVNVELEGGIKGRIDVSEAFKSVDDIKDRKYPLRSFRPKQKLLAKVLGVHDARNHRFLPISHRAGGKNAVLELSARTDVQDNVRSIDDCEVGSWYTAFINNMSDTCVWVNLSPNVRGRIERINVSEDLSVLNDMSVKFPIGSSLQVQVLRKDVLQGQLDLSAIKSPVGGTRTLDTLPIGSIATAKVISVSEQALRVVLPGNLIANVPMTELADDFDLANPMNTEKNEIARICVIDIDKPNKKITASTRPSKVLSSSLPVKDLSISSLDQIKVSDVIRGYVKKVADVGLFVQVSYKFTALVRVTDLFDAFVKDWKSEFEIGRLVTGKVLSIDPSLQKVHLSLKKSVVSDDYTPPLAFHDLKQGQIITGKIRKVEEFGAFIVVDNSHNVSGLCHRSEMAEKYVPDARKIYNEGDLVKALVLKVEPEARKISFGLKASYFQKAGDNDAEDATEDTDSAAQLDDDSDLSLDSDSGGVNVESPSTSNFQTTESNFAHDEAGQKSFTSKTAANLDQFDALDAGGFDWSGQAFVDEDLSDEVNPDDETSTTKKRKKRRAEIKVDHSGDADLHGPQTGNDFERLLLSQRNSSSLWIQYMAFHLQLGEIEEARTIADRALKEININEQDEKLNICVAMLNLENAYGNDDTEEAVFNRACEYSEPEEVRERLASIYIASGKHEKADELFQKMIKKREHSVNVKFWINYATFLFDNLNQAERARQLLDRAMQSIPTDNKRDLVKGFGQLEFKCKNGDAERGRTIFEGLLDNYPKRWDLWDMFVDMERQQKAHDNVRRLFERMASKPMNDYRANKVFKRWLKFEEDHGSAKSMDHVRAKEAAFGEQQSAKKLGIES